ncbi:MAG: potassium channel family protein [Proteobacteria bacterium]|nr:potassium channel family protein [Pseudomonadota bacterium]
MMIRLLFRLFRTLGQVTSATTLKVMVAVVAVIWFSASGYLYFEIQAKPDLTWADGFWWAIVTITTVGYGDFFPESQLGRFLVGVPTMLFGISVLGYLLSTLATYLIESKSKELKGMKQIQLQNHILVAHFSDVNRVVQLVRELQGDPETRGKPIVLIDDQLSEIPAELDELGLKFVHGNPAREATLEQANYTEATHAIVLARDPRDVHSDDMNLAVAMTIEGLNRTIHTVIECVDPQSVEVLRRTGCDSIVCVSQFSSSLLVQELLDPGVKAVFAELTAVRIGQKLYVVHIRTMKDWTFGELRTWGTGQGLLAVGVKRGPDIHLNPTADFAVEQHDLAVVVAGQRPGEIDTTA